MNRYVGYSVLYMYVYCTCNMFDKMNAVDKKYLYWIILIDRITKKEKSS